MPAEVKTRAKSKTGEGSAVRGDAQQNVKVTEQIEWPQLGCENKRWGT